MIAPDSPDSPAPSAADAIAVPLSSLSVDGTPPAVGDEVELTAKGRVVSIDGDNAMIEVSTINDVPVPSEAAEPAAGDEDKSVMEAAMKADAQTA